MSPFNSVVLHATFIRLDSINVVLGLGTWKNYWYSFSGSFFSFFFVRLCTNVNLCRDFQGSFVLR